MKKLAFAAIILLALSTVSLADTSTTHYSLIKPTVGGSPNVWGGKLNTNVDTIDAALWSLGAGVNKGVNSSASNVSDVTLTNPVVSTQLIGFTATGKKLIFPAMNAATSPQAGAVIHVVNTALETYDIVAADTSTPIVASLLAGDDVYITVTSNTTSNGSFRTNRYADTAGANFSLLSITGTGTSVTPSANDNSTKIATTAYVDSSFPTGSIVQFAGTTAPTGWALCYGQAISRSTYSALFSVIGTTYGSGDGSTTYNVPDLRGRVVAGQDDMGGTSANRLTGLSGGIDGDVLGGTGGSESHTLTTEELADHKHWLFTAENAGTNGTSTVNATSSQQIAIVGVSGGSITAYNMTGVSTAATVGLTSDPTTANGVAHNIVQPTIVLNYIIKL